MYRLRERRFWWVWTVWNNRIINANWKGSQETSVNCRRRKGKFIHCATFWKYDGHSIKALALANKYTTEFVTAHQTILDRKGNARRCAAKNDLLRGTSPWLSMLFNNIFFVSNSCASLNKYYFVEYILLLPFSMQCAVSYFGLMCDNVDNNMIVIVVI